MRETLAVALLVGAAAPAEPANTSPPPTSISGVYLTLKASGGYNYGATRDYIVFFADGHAYWHLPAEGLLGFDAARSQREEPAFWGTYEVKGDHVTLHWAGGQPMSGTRNANGTLLLNSLTYVLQSSGVEGQTLDGTYRPDNARDRPDYDVTFHPDGTFEDRGVRTVAGQIDFAYGRAKVPAGPGKGKYQIAQYSIRFEYDDGRMEQLSFYIPEERGKTPPVIVINTFSISRR
jgi:hypothetical protein